MRFTWLTSLTRKSQEVILIIIQAVVQKSTEKGKSQEKCHFFRDNEVVAVVAIVVIVVAHKRQKLRVGVSQHTSDCPFFDYNS
ncbi:hypothetical protein T02_11571 [Trichinella nativa]|uniref:Uncharacterized protein n=2 Tax=Trichinella TaxID=6333 RepID=A0A0V1LMV4_9BILA|nr:hypothetical protein T05_8682 [Trichinella murrelli]KRZ60727.1 hypothetical protein T02_11571 [Trichinella nativa]KRZ90324.1 hypothetical protein T08_16777 [Trichinella sp. T8]